MYTFETHNTDAKIDSSGTYLLGYLDCPRSVLVELFGEPIGPSDKVINEWNLEVTDNFGDTGIITIYDWKNYHLTSLPDDYCEWHVGGHNHSAVVIIRELISQLRTK